MEILSGSENEYLIRRVLVIIKNIIYEAEKKGTGDVQPHKAVLKGEPIDRVIVINRASANKSNL